MMQKERPSIIIVFQYSIWNTILNGKYVQTHIIINTNTSQQQKVQHNENTYIRGSPHPWGYVHQKGVTSGDIKFI